MKKIISFFLAVLMIGSLMPVMAFAASSLTISNPDNWEHISKSSPPTLKWNKISGAPGYLVTVKNDATGEYYAEREKVTKNSYSLKNLFKDELGSSEYPRLKIWVGALNPDGTDSGSQDIIYVVVSEYPDVSFDSYSSVTSNSATLTMTVEKDYGSPIEDCGFYIGKSDKTSEMTKYSFADYGSYSATTKGTKTMTVNGLDSNTTYYVKAYAKNGVGQKETSGKSFKTKVGSNTLSLSQNSVSWGYGSGNEANITVTCSGDYTHTIKYSGVPQSAIDDGYDYKWLDVTPNGNILNIRPKRANYALVDRTAVITVTSGSLSKTITVKQSLYTKGSPIISFSRSGKTLKDGDNLGTYKLQNNNMEIGVACSDVRRLYAELVSVSSGKRFDDFVRPDGSNNDMSKISLDMSNLTAGNYKIIIYASNSDTANDYWSQSPFDDKKFELYFSMVDGSSGNGSDESESGNLGFENISSAKDYPNMPTISEDAAETSSAWTNSNTIVYVQQYFSGCDLYKSSIWENTESGRCTRASVSSAFSYLNIKALPKYIGDTISSGGTHNAKTCGCEHLNTNRFSVCYEAMYGKYAAGEECSVETLHFCKNELTIGNFVEIYNRYANDTVGKYSPPIFYTNYNGDSMHTLLIIGHSKTEENVFYVLDPGNKGDNSQAYLDKIKLEVVDGQVRIAAKTIGNEWKTDAYNANYAPCQIVQYVSNIVEAPGNEKPKTYTVTYDYNYDGGATKTETKKHGETYTISKNIIPTQPQTETDTRIITYKFNGWAIEEEGDVVYQPGDSYTENKNLTLYAQWSVAYYIKNQAQARKYSVVYDANGGSGAPATQTKTENVALTLSNTKPTRNGYTFKGWATSSTATTAQYQPGDSYTANANVTLYAVWKKNTDNQTTYTVKYNANGGSGAPSTQTKTEGKTLTLSSTKPTRSGYTFQGWATTANATTAQYQPGAKYTANANVTLYAVWKAVPKILLGDCNGDGVINARDSQRLYEHIVGKNPFVKDSDEYKAADVNGDGIINARDSQRLYEHIVGKDPLD